MSLDTWPDAVPPGHSRSSERSLSHSQFLDYSGRELERTRKCLSSRFDLLCIEPDCYMATAISNGREEADRLCDAAMDHIGTLLWPRDAIAKLGSGRIAVLLETHSIARSTADFVDDVQRQLMAGFFTNGKEIRTTASIGIARLAAGYQRVDMALDDAGAALSRARRSGRARAIHFNRMIDDRGANLMDLQGDLRVALEDNQLEIHYQPIVSAETGQLDAFEALLRWRHPSRGLQSPDEFLQSLEDAGFMVPVGVWMVREIAAQMATWKEKTGRMIPVTINLTPEQIESTPVFDALVGAMSGPDDLPILIEVSEDTILTNRESVVSVLAPLRERGIRVVLDGFGTGMCCLGYLAGLPVDAIKLDASFAESLARYSPEESTLHQIIGLAHRLDFDVIGSKIESPEQLAEVADLCDDVQGYLISRPVDTVTATAMVESEWSMPLGPLAMPGPVS